MAAPAAGDKVHLLDPVLRLETLGAAATRRTLYCTYFIVLVSIALSLGIQLGYNESTIYAAGSNACPASLPSGGDGSPVSLVGCLSGAPASWMGPNTTVWTGIISNMDRLAGAVNFGVLVPPTSFAAGSTVAARLGLPVQAAAMEGTRSTVTVFSYDASISGMDEVPVPEHGRGRASSGWDPDDPSWQVLGTLKNATGSLACFQSSTAAGATDLSIECTFSPLLDSTWLSFGQPGGGYSRYLLEVSYHNLNLTAYLQQWVGLSGAAPPVVYSVAFETATARVADAVVRSLLLVIALLYTGAWFARMCRLQASAADAAGSGNAALVRGGCCSRGPSCCKTWLPQQRIVGLLLIGLSVLWLNPLVIITGFLVPARDDGAAASSLFQHTTASLRLAAAVLESVAVVGLYVVWWALVDRMKVPRPVIQALYEAGPTAAAGIDGLGSPAARVVRPGGDAAAGRARGGSYLVARGSRALTGGSVGALGDGRYQPLGSGSGEGSAEALDGTAAHSSTLPLTRCSGCNRGCSRFLRRTGCLGSVLAATYGACCCCRCGTVAVTDTESPMAGVKAYPSTGWAYFAPKLSLFTSLAVVSTALILLSEPTLLFCSREAWAGVPGAACPSNPFNGPSRSVALLYVLVTLALFYILLLGVWLFAFAHASITTGRQLARLPYAATRHVQLGYRFLMWQQAIVIGFVIVSQAVPAITFLVQYSKHRVTSTDDVQGGASGSASTQLLVSSLIRSFVSSSTVPLGEALLITSCSLMLAWAFLPAAARSRPAGSASAPGSKATPIRSPRVAGGGGGGGYGFDAAGAGTESSGIDAFASGDDPQAAMFAGSTLDLSRLPSVPEGAVLEGGDAWRGREGAGEGGAASGAGNLLSRSASTFFKTLLEPLKLGFSRSGAGEGEGDDLTFLDPLPGQSGAQQSGLRHPPPPPYVPHFSVGTASWLFDCANVVYFDPPPSCGYPRTPSAYGVLSAVPHGLVLEGVVANDATHSVAWVLRDGWRVIIAFRGTSSRVNISTDLKIRRGAVAFGEAGGDMPGLAAAQASSRGTGAGGGSSRLLSSSGTGASGRQIGLGAAGAEETDGVGLAGAGGDPSASRSIQHAIVSHLPGVRDVALPHIHSGFWAAYTSLRIPLTAVVRSALASAGPHARLFVTGHSLGGALAQLAAFDMSPLVTTHRKACEELKRQAQQARRARRAAAAAAAAAAGGGGSSRRLSSGSGGSGPSAAAPAAGATSSAGDFIRSMGSGIASFGRSLFSKKKEGGGGDLRRPLLVGGDEADAAPRDTLRAATGYASARDTVPTQPATAPGLAVPALPRPLPPAAAPSPAALPPLPPRKASKGKLQPDDSLLAWYDSREPTASSGGAAAARRGSGSSTASGSVAVTGTGTATTSAVGAGGATPTAAGGRRPSGTEAPSAAPEFADTPGSSYSSLLQPCSLGPGIEDDDHEYTAYPDSDEDDEAGGGGLLDLEAGPRGPHPCPLPGYPDVTVYTFGQPRVGNPEFSAQYEARVPLTFRIVVDGDAVSGVPRALSMPLCGLKLRLYKHAGVECWVDLYGNIIVGPSIVERTFRASSRLSFASHRMASYKRALVCARRNEGRPTPLSPAGAAAAAAGAPAPSSR